MKERKNNVNTLLWLMVTLSVMVVFQRMNHKTTLSGKLCKWICTY